MKYMIEIKARNELSPKLDEVVRQKALAATQWCEAASKIQGAKPWQYKLIPDDVIEATFAFSFVLNQAVRVT